MNVEDRRMAEWFQRVLMIPLLWLGGVLVGWAWKAVGSPSPWPASLIAGAVLTLVGFTVLLLFKATRANIGKSWRESSALQITGFIIAMPPMMTWFFAMLLWTFWLVASWINAFVLFAATKAEMALSPR